MRQVAVLTGDIVKSTQMPLGMLDEVFERLSETAEIVTKWQGSPTYLTRNRGDGWQMLAEPSCAFRAVLAACAAVRSVSKRADTRIALAIGGGHIPGSSLADASGPAFIASGRALEKLKSRRTLAFAETEGVNALFLRLAEEIVARWTEAQAQVALRAFAPAHPTQDEIAKSLGVTPQTVNGHFEAGGFDALIEMCDFLEGRTST